MQAVFETLFDLVYLITVITLGICMIRGNRGRRQYLLYGVMAVMLGCGDAFHLVPRAVALCTTGLADYTAALVGHLAQHSVCHPRCADCRAVLPQGKGG